MITCSFYRSSRVSLSPGRTCRLDTVLVFLGKTPTLRVSLSPPTCFNGGKKKYSWLLHVQKSEKSPVGHLARMQTCPTYLTPWLGATDTEWTRRGRRGKAPLNPRSDFRSAGLLITHCDNAMPVKAYACRSFLAFNSQPCLPEGK